MGFNYDEIQRKNDRGEGQWTSFSDLFMVLSSIFLMLYVLASLRQGTSLIQAQRLAHVNEQEVQNLKTQVQYYESLKDEYLHRGATEQQKKQYEDVVAHLNLLKENARNEKEAALAKAKEGEQKEQELNQYQALVKSVISAHLVGQSKLKEERERSVEQKREIKNLERVISKNQKKVEEIQTQAERRIAEMKVAYQKEKKTKAALERLNAAIEKEKHLSQQKIAELQGKTQAYSTALERARSEIHGKEKQIGVLTEKTKGLEGELGSALQKANARKFLAERIGNAFGRAGIKAGVDPNSGDVTIDFGDAYFEKGSSQLQPKMQEVLKKLLPVYAASLLEDHKVAEKIDFVEIVGYASPTYGGKLVNPKSLSQADQKAFDYNMDLSYRRARNIFKYAFDTQKMQFKHQRELLPLVKVTGRSYLTVAKINKLESQEAARSPAALKEAQDACTRFNCNENQKVIIRFNLKE